jgi:uncharacterized integral membrane protein
MIQEGLIWTYYDCSHACYLFGKFELPCIFMTVSYALFALVLVGLILFVMCKFAKQKKTGVKKDEE